MNMRTAQRTHILKENRLKEKNIPRGNPTLLSTVDPTPEPAEIRFLSQPAVSP